MSLKRALGALLVSRMAGGGAGRGGLGAAAILGMLGGSRRGGIAGKAGFAGLAYMAYQAYQAQQARSPGTASNATRSSSDGGLGGILQELANRFGFSGSDQTEGSAGQQTGSPRSGATMEAEAVLADAAAAERAASEFSDENALLLIRAMITAANSDGAITPEERSRILRHLDASGADSDDRRIVELEMDNPKPLDDLIEGVKDQDTARAFYLASRAAMDGADEKKRAYLLNLRHRLSLSNDDAAEIEGLAV